MKKVPEANASWHGDFIRQYHDVNVSVAVQTPAGLQVPVLRGADRMGLTDISSGIKDIATKVSLLCLLPWICVWVAACASSSSRAWWLDSNGLQLILLRWN